jgi:hypothetical protein
MKARSEDGNEGFQTSIKEERNVKGRDIVETKMSRFIEQGGYSIIPKP